MEFLVDGWSSIVGLVKSLQLTDGLDVLVISFVIYNRIKLARETQTEQLVKGLLVLLPAWGVPYCLNLHMAGVLLNHFSQSSVFTLLVMFQSEMRRVLEQIGRSGLGSNVKGWLFIGIKGNADLRQKLTCGINVVVEAVVVL